MLRRIFAHLHPIVHVVLDIFFGDFRISVGGYATLLDVGETPIVLRV